MFHCRSEKSGKCCLFGNNRGLLRLSSWAAGAVGHLLRDGVLREPLTYSLIVISARVSSLCKTNCVCQALGRADIQSLRKRLVSPLHTARRERMNRTEVLNRWVATFYGSSETIRNHSCFHYDSDSFLLDCGKSSSLYFGDRVSWISGWSIDLAILSLVPGAGVVDVYHSIRFYARQAPTYWATPPADKSSESLHPSESWLVKL